jgi:hypothetical protein
MKNGLYFLLFIFSLLVITVSFASNNSPKNSTNKIIMTGKTPNGVFVKKNKVTIKSGYTFNRISDNQVNVIAKKKDGTGPVSGEFTCGCQTNGSCKLVIDGTSIWCAANTCGSSCQMTVSIPSMMNTLQ